MLKIDLDEEDTPEAIRALRDAKPCSEHFDPDEAEAFNRRVDARAAAGDPTALALIAAFAAVQPEK